MSDAEALLARPRFFNGGWLNTRLNWTDRDVRELRILCGASVSPEKAADAIGRSPSSIAWRARDAGLVLPAEWSKIIRPERKAASGLRIQLAYPYIIKKRDGHADLLAVNNIVPHGMPGREDVCQEIMLAMWEGRITVEQLRANAANLRAFIRAFKAANYEASGYATSLDAPVFGTDNLTLIDTISTEHRSVWN